MVETLLHRVKSLSVIFTAESVCACMSLCVCECECVSTRSGYVM